MKKITLILAVFCSILTADAVAQAQIDKMTEVEARVPTKHPAPEKSPVPIIIDTLRQNKNVEIYRSDLGKDENRYSLEIEWSEGENTLLSFRGQEYKLRISYKVVTVNKETNETKNVINFARLSFKDTTGSAKINVKKNFDLPFKDALNAEFERLLQLGLDCLMEQKTNDDPRLIERFDLRPFYH
jgi:hypothetical protein